MQDRARRHRQHLLAAFAARDGDVNGGDLDLILAVADEDRCAGISMAALAGMLKEPAAAARPAELAIAVGGHGVPAILPIARNLRAGADRKSTRLNSSH